MRIGGYGSDFGQTGGDRDRAAAFRARHSVGQRVKGRILRREATGLYWVQVGGEELLARLEVHADPGDQLMFIVQALTPEIVLKALSGGMEADDLPGLIQRFRAAREVFETQDASVLAPLSAVPPQRALRAEAFSQAMARQPAAAEHLAKTQEYLAHINARIATQNAAALYEPWLFPALRRQESLRRPRAGGVETAMSATDAQAGQIEVRFAASAEPRLVVSAEHPDGAGSLLVELAAMGREILSAEPMVLGPARLRPSSLGGVLGELFADAPTWSSGGLNTRV